MTDRDKPQASDYAPYNKFPEFTHGIEGYFAHKLESAYTGVKAQAYDRGLDFAMRLTAWERCNNS